MKAKKSWMNAKMNNFLSLVNNLNIVFIKLLIFFYFFNCGKIFIDRPETVNKLQRDLNDDKQCKCIVYLVLGLLIILFFIGIYFSLFFNY